jgi:hypothetical protein
MHKIKLRLHNIPLNIKLAAGNYYISRISSWRLLTPPQSFEHLADDGELERTFKSSRTEARQGRINDIEIARFTRISKTPPEIDLWDEERRTKGGWQMVDMALITCQEVKIRCDLMKILHRT